MGSLSPMHWLIVIGVLVLLFGATKLPKLARSMGQSARIFQAETRGMKADENAAEQDKSTQSEPNRLASGKSSTSTASPVEDTQRKDSQK